MIMSLQRSLAWHRALIIMAIGVVIRRHDASASRLRAGPRSLSFESAPARAPVVSRQSPLASRRQPSLGFSAEYHYGRARNERAPDDSYCCASHCAARCRLEGTLQSDSSQVGSSPTMPSLPAGALAANKCA